MVGMVELEEKSDSESEADWLTDGLPVGVVGRS